MKAKLVNESLNEYMGQPKPYEKYLTGPNQDYTGFRKAVEKYYNYNPNGSEDYEYIWNVFLKSIELTIGLHNSEKSDDDYEFYLERMHIDDMRGAYEDLGSDDPNFEEAEEIYNEWKNIVDWEALEYAENI